jgi:tRNA-dihydrouridine synthase B
MSVHFSGAAVMQIGPHKLQNNLIVAPMAGVTDRPFRLLCRALGAGMAVSEMISSNPRLRDTLKSRRRSDPAKTAACAVQIACRPADDGRSGAL